MTFESAITESLAIFEPAARAARKGASAAAAAGKMLANGEIKSISKKVAEAEEELVRALDSIKGFQAQWEVCSIDDYFGSEEYWTELVSSLVELGVDHHRLDDVLYVYPAFVRLDRVGRMSRIDRKAEARLRPQMLARILRDIQNRPARLPAGKLLAALFKVYKALGSRNLKKSVDWAGKPMFLRDIFEILSAAPGADYSEQEFARDIYLLDASGESMEVRGHVATLEASSATRDQKKTLSVITRDGQRRLYCTIRFDPIRR